MPKKPTLTHDERFRRAVADLLGIVSAGEQKLRTAIHNLILAGSDGSVFDWRRAVADAEAAIAETTGIAAPVVAAWRRAAAEPGTAGTTKIHRTAGIRSFRAAAKPKKPHWTQTPAGRRKMGENAAIANRNRGRRAKAKPKAQRKPHWTTLPENKAKLASVLALANKAKALNARAA